MGHMLQGRVAPIHNMGRSAIGRVAKAVAHRATIAPAPLRTTWQREAFARAYTGLQVA